MTEITISEARLISILQMDFATSKQQSITFPFEEHYLMNEIKSLENEDDWTMNIFLNPRCTPVLVNMGYIEHYIQKVPDTDDPTLLIDYYKLTLKGRWVLYLYRIKLAFQVYVKNVTFEELSSRKEYYTFPI